MIIGSGVEFGFSNAANTDTVDFTGNSVTLQDVVAPNRPFTGNAAINFVFTDPLFAGATGTLGPDNFPNGVTASLVGDILFLAMAPNGHPPEGATWDATFNIVVANNNVVPLPAALPLFASGLVGLGLLGWRRKKKASAA